MSSGDRTPGSGNSAPPERVAEMFDRISGVYDAMNLAISGFQEPRWRRHAVRETRLGPGGRALDVACGTGKVTRDLWRAVQPGGSALGVDFSEGMIELARDRAEGDEGLRFVIGDALKLPVEDDAFDAATIAFGMRNLSDYQTGLRRDGARRATGRPRRLSRDRPAHEPLGKLIGRWFDSIVPLIGRLVGQGSAYAYLVQSTKDYPAPGEIARIMRSAGLREVDWYGLSFGIVTIHTGTVAEVADQER